MSVSAVKITAQLQAVVSKTLADESAPSHKYAKGLYEIVPSDADLLYHNRHEVGATGTVDLDVAGTLEDALGVACVFSTIYAIYIRNLSTTSGDKVYVGGDDNSVPLFGAVADYFILPANGVFLVTSPVDGWSVTGATGDIIEISNPGGTAVNVDVGILGKA
jgi:hypothetical protein